MVFLLFVGSFHDFLRGDVEIFLQEVLDRTKRLANGFVECGRLILPPQGWLVRAQSEVSQSCEGCRAWQRHHPG